MNTRRSLILRLAAALLVFTAAGCQARSPVPAGESAAVTGTPTQQSAPQDELLPQVELTPQSGDRTPLRFIFPTPGPAPVSVWRPPLYEVPWALGPNDHFYFQRPIAADEVNWPLADYRYGGIFPGTNIAHTGVDIDARRSTPVLAAAAGEVIWAGYGLYAGSFDLNDPYGQAVAIQHDFGFNGKKLYTVYAHMDRVDAVVGQRVQAGDQLGLVGDTGNTTGPHLHFEVRLGSNSYFATRNPELWLSPPQGWGVLTGRMFNTNGSFLTGQEVTVKSNATGRRWVVVSYGTFNTLGSDEYYRENMVLSDLPAGDYKIRIDYNDKTFETDISIHPGAVTSFLFRGERGFLPNPLPTPDAQTWLNPPAK